MSQEKVDKYKQEKANRKKIMRREKMKKYMRRCVGGAICLVLIGWLGYSAYGAYSANKPVPSAELDYAAIDNYMQSLSGTTAE